ncbi:MAG: proteasome ATPase, partial [Arcanobacterium sp.]|nr:proteasome ATPase [Arcanobacterium sp.]
MLCSTGINLCGETLLMVVEGKTMVADESPDWALTELVATLEEKNGRLALGLQEARKKITELSEQIDALSGPPSSYAIFLSANHVKRTVTALVGGRKMTLNTSTLVELGVIKPGQELILNEQMVVIGVGSYNRTGEIVITQMLVGNDRVLVKVHASDERVLLLSGRLQTQGVRVGDLLMADLHSGFAYEIVERPDVEHLLLEETPDVTYQDIGGLENQIEEIRDAVELPFEQPELFRAHGLKPPKGILLYGPPGCGKTLIAKAVAASLSQKIAEADPQQRQQAYFLNVKGPQLLDKYVGETERQIREIFARARDRASQGIPVVIFFDEMEALFRTRGSGISSDLETTVVPQLLAEIDGVEQLNNVIVIGASNREDMIDPAILRPGRLDVKIRIERPTREGAEEILLKYLKPELPIREDELSEFESVQPALERIARTAIEKLFAKTPENEFVKLFYKDGTNETLYISDLVSGALIAAIVDRAKKLAIKDYLAGGVYGIATEHLLRAI